MRAIIVAAITVVSLVAPLHADIVYKTNGGRLKGTVDKSKSDRNSVTIKTRFGTFTVDRSKVEKIEFQEDSAEDYQKKAKTFKDTAQDQYALALWCLKNDHRDEYKKHLERVIELDPDHGEARTRLGYQLFDGEWKTRDEYFKEQGYVKYRGEWVLPQEKERMEKDRDFTKRQREYYRSIRIWQKWLKQTRPERREEADKKLRAIDDLAAVKPLFEILGEKGDVSDRRLLVDVLASIPEDLSTEGLVLVAVNDEVSVNRNAATEALKSRKSVRLVNRVAAFLKDNESSRVKHAATVLGEIGDDSIVPVLVDALITRHKHVFEPSFEDMVRAGSGVQYKPQGRIVRPDGVVIGPSYRAQNPVIGGGVRAGAPPGKQVVIEVKKNQEVVDALVKLTGKNYGFDRDRWLRWVQEEYRNKAATISN